MQVAFIIHYIRLDNWYLRLVLSHSYDRLPVPLLLLFYRLQLQLPGFPQKRQMDLGGVDGFGGSSAMSIFYHAKY